jgi:dermatan/chondrotin sulfate uronyl 2-O-sulfotransferase UST
MKLFSACVLSMASSTLTSQSGTQNTAEMSAGRRWVTMNDLPRVTPPAPAAAASTAAPTNAPEPTSDEALLAPRDVAQPPNPTFVFHNKLPKSGSTTMKYIADQMAIKNNFKMDYVPPCLHPPCNAKSGDMGDGIGAKEALVNHVKEARPVNDKYFLLKHQYYLNFTNYETEQPTMINVVRDPVSRFSSMYYFNRYGFASMGSQARQGVARHVWKGKEEDIDQTLDECIIKQSDECLEPIQVMVRYFCGTGAECGMKGAGQGAFGAKNDWNKVARAAELAKHNIINNYYAIGIVEQFDASLDLFEKLLPDFFTGAKAAYHSEEVMAKRSSSSTAVKHGFNNETRAYMEAGPLRYEMDLYNLIVSIFKQRLAQYGIVAEE